MGPVGRCIGSLLCVCRGRYIRYTLAEEVGGEVEFLGPVVPALDLGEGDAQLFGDGAEGFVLLAKQEDLAYLFQVVIVGDVLGLEVVGLNAYANVVEVGEAVGLFDAVEGYFVGRIRIVAAAELAGLYVADGGVGDGDADADDGVEEGGEHGAAEHRVAGEGLVAFAFGGVGDDDNGEVVLFAEGADAGHDGAGGLALFHVGTEEGDVVYDDDLETGGGGVSGGLRVCFSPKESPLQR